MIVTQLLLFYLPIMSDAATASAGNQTVVAPANDAMKAKGLSSKKKTAAAGKTGSSAAKKQAVNHPKYSEMVHQALTSLKERGGSSRQAVLKYIMKNFNVGKDENVVNTHLKMALRAGVKNAMLKQSKGSGATGSFRLGEEAKKKPKAPASTKAAKKVKAPPAAKIRKTTKSTAGDKSVKSPKKKMTKKATTKSVTKSTSKPKVEKKVAAKKPKMDKPKKSAETVKKVKTEKTKKSPPAAGAKKPVVKKPVAKKTPLAKKSAKKA